MELMNTPIIPNQNENENLIQSEQNRVQKANASQYFVEKSDQSSKEYNTFNIKFYNSNLPIYILSYALIAPFMVPAIIIPNLILYLRIAIGSIGVILSLIILISDIYKIILVKDTINKKVLVKLINHLCFPKKKFNLNIENIHFYIHREISYDDEGMDEIFTLLIINDYKNLMDIDLDASNIKKKPAKLFYSFKGVKFWNYSSIEYAQVLNNFIGSSGIDDNPLFFNIDEYLNKSQNNLYSNPKLSNYMKFSDYFFTFHLCNPLQTSRFGNCCKIIAILVNLYIISAAVFVLVNKKVYANDKIMAGIFFAICNIIIFILYKLCEHCCVEKIVRIDCIYSKNFDRIFIGIVKYNKTKYINTFEYEINNISRFMLERVGNSSDTNYDLIAVFKNNETQKICTIKNKTQEELEGLAYILNERLNNNSNGDIDCN